MLRILVENTHFFYRINICSRQNKSTYVQPYLHIHMCLQNTISPFSFIGGIIHLIHSFKIKHTQRTQYL